LHRIDSFFSRGCLFLAGVIIAALPAFAAIRVCPRCGHELGAAAVQCSHCNASTPLPPAPEPVRDSVEGCTLTPDGKLQFIDGKIVDLEIEEGMSVGRDGDGDAAYYFFRNAMALQLLADPSRDEGRTARLTELIGRCGERGGGVRAVCADCNGTGRAVLSGGTTRRDTTRLVASSLPCQTCSGRGFMIHFGAINERKYQIGQAWSRYMLKQQSRLFTSVGNAWLPRTIENRLSATQRAALKRATADACADCAGIGRTQCRRCSGRGLVPCSNSKCDRGKVRSVSETGISRTKLTQTKPCDVCGGRGTISCSACSGQGSVLCSKCDGRGFPPSCDRCGGQGVIDCSRCKGQGVSGGVPCSYCAGDGKTECGSCGGDGRR